jgi:hypothetical protein
MAQFTAEVFQNEFCPTADRRARDRRGRRGAGQAGQTSAADAAEIIIIDTSGSMGERIAQGRNAATAVNEIDGTWFGPRSRATTWGRGLPRPGGRSRWSDTRRRGGGDRAMRRSADGTAMGTWLSKARCVDGAAGQ